MKGMKRAGEAMKGKDAIFLILLMVAPLVLFMVNNASADPDQIATTSKGTNDELASLYLNEGQDMVLTPAEQEALRLVAKWVEGGRKGAAPITQGSDGAIQFIFGASQPTVLCAPLQITDIELEPGEQVYSLHLGDNVRWHIEPAITGYGNNEIHHVVVKAKDVGLTTSLMITTDRRTYHITLKSHSTKYYPRIAFVYPETMLNKWGNIQARRDKEIQRDTIPGGGEYLGNLDFNYKIQGKAKWKPLRVFNDGQKTILQMPEEMKQSEAPTLLVVRQNGNGKDLEQVMVNYRVQGDRYIVDSIFDKAILIVGVEKNQDKVTITRGKAKSSTTTINATNMRR